MHSLRRPPARENDETLRNEADRREYHTRTIAINMPLKHLKRSGAPGARFKMVKCLAHSSLANISAGLLARLHRTGRPAEGSDSVQGEVVPALTDE